MPLLAFLPMLTACDSDDNDDEPSSGVSRPLTGTWVCDYSSTETDIYAFNADGSGSFSTVFAAEVYTDNFIDYKVENGLLWIMWEGDNEFDDEADIRNITDNSFQLRWDNNDPWLTFTKVK